jgi:hypothetical protein
MRLGGAGNFYYEPSLCLASINYINMPSPEASRANLELARAVRGPCWRQPRLWRSREESRLIRQLVWQEWWNAQKYHWRAPSGRALARKFGISHTWAQKLLREVRGDPGKLQEEFRLHGLATMQLLFMAQEKSHEMRANGELRDRVYSSLRISWMRRRGINRRRDIKEGFSTRRGS